MKRDQMKNVLRNIFLILTLVILNGMPAACQLNNHLILKRGSKSIKHFIAGDSIIFQKNNFETPVFDQIQGIGQDFIIIKGEELPIREITGIVHIRALHYREAGIMFNIAGPVLIMIDGFNSLIRRFHPIFGTNILIAGAAIFGTGFLLPLLQSKVYHMDKGYYLRIVPSDPETYRDIKQIR